MSEFVEFEKRLQEHVAEMTKDVKQLFVVDLDIQCIAYRITEGF